MLVGLWIPTLMPMVPEVPAWSVQSSAGYYLPDRAANMTQLFVVSATPKYGFYPVEPENFAGPYMLSKGDPCFIMDITIRNDYNSQNPVPARSNSNGNSTSNEVWFCVHAILYDKNGVLHVPAVTPPYPQMPFGVPQFHQTSGATNSYKLYFWTSNRNINHYLIYISYLAPQPAT
jgi:hypothetical protein